MKRGMDVSDFQREFEARVRRSHRSLAEICNWAAYSILGRCIALTKRASHAEIEALGITGYVVLGGKKGNRKLKRPKPIYKPSTRWRAIFAAKMWKRGHNPRKLAPGQFDAMANTALAHRISSIGFVASGWVKPLRRILHVLKTSVSAGTIPKTFPTTMGDATPAREGDWSPSVEFYNATAMNIPGQDEKSAARVEKMLGEVIDKAFAAQAQEWHDFAERKIDEAMNG